MSESPKKPDPRRHAWRMDLADERLRGTVEAPRYISGELRQVIRATVAVRKLPDVRKGFETELLFGETVYTFDEADGWAWVQSARDHYVGYVPVDALDGSLGKPTHVVRATSTFLYPEPNIKTPPAMALPLNALLRVLETQDRFAALAGGGYVMAHHLAPVGQPARDFVAIAERFEGTPYLWGGRTRIGIDCSGLVQISMHAATLDCPRDTDMQVAEVGTALDVAPALSSPNGQPSDPEGLVRGDLVFWPGHVGIMTDGVMLLHANGHHMSTVVEPVMAAAQRIFRQTGKGVTAVRRHPSLPSSAAQPIASTASTELAAS